MSRGKECTSGKWPHRTTQYFDYGTVMYTIQPESADIQDHPLYVKHEIQAWRPKQGFQRARKSGYLFFSVNDLILEPTDSAKAYYEKKYTSDSLYVMNPLLQDSIRFAKDIGKSDSLRLVEYKLRAIRNDIKNDLREKEIVLKDPHFLYKDNLGQLLVAVEIKRTITPFFWRWPEVFFRGFESSICWMKESLHSLKTRCYLAPKDNNGPYNTVRWLSNTLTGVTYYAAFIIGAIFLFFSFGLANMVMLFVWTILLCAVICFVLQLRHWMVQFYRRARRKQCNNQKESS